MYVHNFQNNVFMLGRLMDVNSNKIYGSGCCICLAHSALREVLIDNNNIKLGFLSLFC